MRWFVERGFQDLLLPFQLGSKEGGEKHDSHGEEGVGEVGSKEAGDVILLGIPFSRGEEGAAVSKPKNGKDDGQSADPEALHFIYIYGFVVELLFVCFLFLEEEGKAKAKEREREGRPT